MAASGTSFCFRSQWSPSGRQECIHLAVAGHHLMLELYGRLAFQPVCVFHGLNGGRAARVCGARVSSPPPPGIRRSGGAQGVRKPEDGSQEQQRTLVP